MLKYRTTTVSAVDNSQVNSIYSCSYCCSSEVGKSVMHTKGYMIQDLPPPWKCSRPGWMEVWATWSSGGCPCSWQGGWNQMIF